MPDSRGKCTSFPSTQLRVFHCGCSHLQDTSSFPPLQPTSERCRLNVNDRCRFLEHLLSKTAVEINFVGSADLPCHSFNGCKQTNTVKRDGLLDANGILNRFSSIFFLVLRANKSTTEIVCTVSLLCNDPGCILYLMISMKLNRLKNHVIK